MNSAKQSVICRDAKRDISMSYMLNAQENLYVPYSIDVRYSILKIRNLMTSKFHFNRFLLTVLSNKIIDKLGGTTIDYYIDLGCFIIIF